LKPPAFQFYTDDFLGGTMNFTDSEAGLYIRLLCVQWNTGSVPDDDLELKNYGKGETPVDRIRLKFKKCADGNLRNSRMEIERKKQKAFRKSRSENGKLGGRPRKPSEKLVVSSVEAKISSPSPSPSPVSLEEREGAPTLSEIPSWNEFWEYCQGVHCGIAAEWFAKDKFEAANADRWKGKSDWRAYARRCKGWWQNDGSPMKPNQNHGNTNAKNGVQRIDRSIGTANEGIASRYKDFGKVVKPPNP
jgi:uncharacterized protein YdaU (DUF1376 family)